VRIYSSCYSLHNSLDIIILIKVYFVNESNEMILGETR